jgi:hypothetical protein
MYICVHVEFPSFLVFYETYFLDRFSENTLISKFMKIRLIGAPCGETDMKKLIIACHNFANAPNNACAHAEVGG